MYLIAAVCLSVCAVVLIVLQPHQLTTPAPTDNDGKDRSLIKAVDSQPLLSLHSLELALRTDMRHTESNCLMGDTPDKSMRWGCVIQVV